MVYVHGVQKGLDALRVERNYHDTFICRYVDVSRFTVHVGLGFLVGINICPVQMGD